MSRLPEAERESADAYGSLPAMGCLTRMHVVRLLAPSLEGEDHTKDIDFSPAGIRSRREAGYADTMRVLDLPPGAATSTRSRASSCTRLAPARS